MSQVQKQPIGLRNLLPPVVLIFEFALGDCSLPQG
jgi:hypothetical protein